MPTKHKTPKQVVTSIRLPEEMHTKLAEVAAKQHRSVSGQVRLLVEELLERSAA